jgi:hypothetical protein
LLSVDDSGWGAAPSAGWGRTQREPICEIAVLEGFPSAADFVQKVRICACTSARVTGTHIYDALPMPVCVGRPAGSDAWRGTEIELGGIPQQFDQADASGETRR